MNTDSRNTSHCWKLHTAVMGLCVSSALYSVAACGLEITHFWKQKPDTPLCLLLAYFCFCFLAALILLSSWLAHLRAICLNLLQLQCHSPQERWPPLQVWWICHSSSATPGPTDNKNNTSLCIFMLVHGCLQLKQIFKLKCVNEGQK